MFIRRQSTACPKQIPYLACPADNRTRSTSLKGQTLRRLDSAGQVLRAVGKQRLSYEENAE